MSRVINTGLILYHIEPSYGLELLHCKWGLQCLCGEMYIKLTQPSCIYLCRTAYVNNSKGLSEMT